MKTLIRYLSLLLISGLIIPFYLKLSSPDLPDLKPAYTLKSITQPAANQCYRDAFHFSFITDMAEKIIPAIKNLY